MALAMSVIFYLVWLVGIYNLGFLLASKILGSKVSEFEIGYGGPKLATFTLGNVRYTLSSLLGGSRVRLDEVDHLSPKYIILLCSGPFAVFLLSCFLAWGYLIRNGFEVVVPEGAVIIESTSADSAPNLKQGDIITMAGDQPIQDGWDLDQQLATWESGELVVIVIRDGHVRRINLNRYSAEQELGIVFSSLTESRRLGFFDTLKNVPGFLMREAVAFIEIPYLAVCGLLGSRPKTTSVFELHQNGALFLAQVLSLGLVVANILPLPGLVGEQALIATFEVLFQRRFSESTKASIWLVCLILTGIFVMIPKLEMWESIVRWTGINVKWSV